MEILGFRLPAWIPLLLLVLLMLYIYVTWTFDTFSNLGIPGPKPWPFIGNMYQMLFSQGVEVFDNECVKKYGKVIGHYEMRSPNIMVADPAVLKQIMVKEFQYFTNRKSLGGAVQPPFDRALTSLKDTDWKRVRSLMTPAFSSGKLKNMVQEVNTCADIFMECLQEKSKEGDVPIKQLFAALTTDIIARVGFGADVNSQKNPDDVFVKNVNKLFRQRTLLVILILICPKLLPILQKWFNWNLMPIDAMDFFARFTEKLMEKSKDHKERGSNIMELMMKAHEQSLTNADTQEDKDIGFSCDASDLKKTKKNSVNTSCRLGNCIHHSFRDGVSEWGTWVASDNPEFLTWNKYSLPVGSEHIQFRLGTGMTNDELMANAMQLFTAGSETTAATLTLLSYILAVNPEIQERLRKEVDDVIGEEKVITPQMYQKLPYLNQCCEEILRLYPPALRVDRTCSEDVTINGVQFKKGMAVSICINAVHHDPDNYPNPEKFDPKRFTSEAKAARDPLTYIPFGFGPRNCIGMRLAQMELKITMIKILQKMVIKTCEKTQIPIKMRKTAFRQTESPVVLRIEPRK